MISDVRRQDLYIFTRDILEEFEVAYLPTTPLQGQTYDRLLDGPAARTAAPSPLMIEFLQFAVKWRTFRPGESAAVLSRPIAHPSHPKPASWLLRNPRTGLTTILLDRGRVLSTAYRNMHRFVTYLCLHEIGHVLLHLDDLFAPNIGGLAPLAAPRQEEEAWFFCFCVASLIAERVAERFASAAIADRGSMPHVWEMIRDNIL